MNFKRKYNNNEYEIIKQYYPIGGYKLVQKHLPYLTAKQISSIASKLKISSPRNFTDEEIIIIQKYYPLGGAELVQQYLPHRSRETIYQKARKLGIQSPINYFTEEDDNIIIKYYPDGGSKEVQKRLPHHSIQSIQQRAFILGIKYNGLSYNENYFNVIDSSDKAYWLGFIYTDGYITKDGRFGIELSVTDKSHLQKFIDAIDGNIKIKERKKKCLLSNKDVNTCLILLNNKQLFNSLIRLGVTSDKTYTIKMPSLDILPKKFVFDFLRGVIDGDGTIGIYNEKSYIRFEVSLVSASKLFIEEIQKILLDYNINSIITTTFREKRVPLYRLRCEQKQSVLRFLYLLYHNSSENNRLKRKHDKYLQILSHCNSDGFRNAKAL